MTISLSDELLQHNASRLLNSGASRLERHSKHDMSDRAWKLYGGWCNFSSDPQIDMVQGFIVYSRIDNIMGCGVPANPTRTIYTEEMICTAEPRPRDQIVTPSHFLSPDSFCWRPQSAELNLHQTSLKHFSTAILVDHSMACSFIRRGAI